ncbi:hypothetical protein [Clavibacter zhangzhiyongii]|uniref:hypothetical protein n=1 Tax=Clavibacter zhangzhiyongii TaxID=2768071 RepID=UPI0039E1DDC3
MNDLPERKSLRFASPVVYAWMPPELSTRNTRRPSATTAEMTTSACDTEVLKTRCQRTCVSGSTTAGPPARAFCSRAFASSPPRAMRRASRATE